jgi:flagellar protein FliS
MYAQQYVENDVLDKSPVELIRLLYSKAIDKLRQAIEHTAVDVATQGAGDIRERGACLARVMEIVAELQGALNPEAGGALAADLARLYDYMQRLLIEAATDSAAVQQLEEVKALLGNLYEGWSECEPQLPAQERSDSEGLAEPARNSALRLGPSGDDGLASGELTAPVAPAGYSGSECRVWTL